MQYIEGLIKQLKKTWRFLQKPVVKTILVIFIFAFAAYYVSRQSTEFSEVIQAIDLDFQKLVLIILLIIITIILGIGFWHEILAWLGYSKPWFPIAKGYAYSAIAKYIPGFIWHYASRTYFVQELTIPLKIIGAALTLELALSTLMGSMLAAISFFFTNQSTISTLPNINYFVIGIFILLISLLVMSVSVIKKFLRKFIASVQFRGLHHLIKGLLANFSGWILMGFAFWLVCDIIGIPEIQLGTAIFYHSVSFVSGTLVVFIPNGLIIREAGLAFLGQGFFDQTALILSGSLFRILILFAEASLALIFVILSIIKLKKSGKESE
jgi:hypothetical protein